MMQDMLGLMVTGMVIGTLAAVMVTGMVIARLAEAGRQMMRPNRRSASKAAAAPEELGDASFMDVEPAALRRRETRAARPGPGMNEFAALLLMGAALEKASDLAGEPSRPNDEGVRRCGDGACETAAGSAAAD